MGRSGNAPGSEARVDNKQRMTTYAPGCADGEAVGHLQTLMEEQFL